jgi:hypothetical protein
LMIRGVAHFGETGQQFVSEHDRFRDSALGAWS